MFGSRPGKRPLSPRQPVYRVMSMLQQIGAFFMNQGISGHE
jgi:hypothetical protein